MPPTLESGAFEAPDKNKKEIGEKEEHIAKKVEEIASKLKDLENTNVYYPFKYETILSLYGLRGTPEGNILINEKQGILKQIIAAIDNEKEKKYWIPSESNDKIVSVLEELTGKSTGAEGEPIRH